MNNTKKKSILLYGAGIRASSEYMWIKESYNVKCFIDKNKRGTVLMPDGKSFSVLSLTDALEKYPEALIYITAGILLKYEITAELLRLTENKPDFPPDTCIITKDDIINYEPVSEKKSCALAESSIYFSEDNQIKLCCHGVKRINYDNSMTDEELLQYFLAYRNDVINSISNCDDSYFCKNCIKISRRFYSEVPKIRRVGFSVGSVCQFRCCYCTADESPSLSKQKNLIRALDFFDYLRQKSYIDENTEISFAAGEISINPLRGKIYDTLNSHRCVFYTNAEFYSEEIAGFLNKGSTVNVSVDAGTKETFKKVKGRDCYEKVTETILKYSSSGPVELKFIILPGLNDNPEDAEGFVDLAVKSKASVIITRDIYNTEKFDLNINSCLDTARIIASEAQSKGLKVLNLLNNFNSESSYKQLLSDID